ncbi:MAG: hypothetical protein OEY70_15180, partial [Acidimicrobiia bacterium]|nr:hypothetical protein [Acidimicrobiia bacterium]
WQATNARIVELEGQAAAMALESPDEQSAVAMENLGWSAASLRAALNADVSLRTDPALADRDDLFRFSAQTVQQRRMDLNTALLDPALRTRR